MNKAYERITWQNSPSMDTPLGARNLNKMDYGLDEIDNRVISMDTAKADKSQLNGLIIGWVLDKKTGVVTVTHFDGSVETTDTPMEKVAVNYRYDKKSQILYIVQDDDTEQEVDLSSLISQYEFSDTDTVTFTISADGEVSAAVKEGSIEEKHLRADYLAEIKVESAKAESSATSAAGSANEASQSVTAAKESETNAATSADAAKASEDAASGSADSAKESETIAANSASNAKSSEENAKASETSAKASESNALASADAAQTSETNAKASETTAKESENNASDSANFSKSYAVGGTGTREGEDSDNAKYYMNMAKSVSGIEIATTDTAGIVKADGSSITVEEDGTIHAKGIFTKDDIIAALGYTPVQSVSITLTENGHLESEVI